MSLSKFSFPKLNPLVEDTMDEVKEDIGKLGESAQQLKTDIKKGVEEVEENISEGKTFSNPVSDFFSKYPIKSAEEDVPADIDAEQGDDDAEQGEDTAVKQHESIPEHEGEKDVALSMSKVIENTLGINTVSSDEETDSDDEAYLQKFDEDVKKNYLLDFHPEAQSHNYEEVKTFATAKRNKKGDIIDPLHRTIPILTKYEKTRVLGQRAKQLNSGAQSTVKIPDSTIDGYLMAVEELRQRKLPFIIRRPIPNGGFEYWKVSDLELLE